MGFRRTLIMPTYKKINVLSNIGLKKERESVILAAAAGGGEKSRRVEQYGKETVPILEFPRDSPRQPD